MNQNLRKGIIMAAGEGSRLAPTTVAVSKHLIPVFNKPMIFYPLTTLMLAGVREILIITNPEHLDAYRKLLADGSQWGVRISYDIQECPKGIPDGLLIARRFLQGCPCIMILGDNIFYGDGFPKILNATLDEPAASIFSYKVKDPERYAMIDFADDGEIANIVEKPIQPSSDSVVSGLYYLPGDAGEYAAGLTASGRGELEISELLRIYLKQNRLNHMPLGRGMTWFDVGTHESLLEASQYVRVLESRQGQKIAWPDEVAKNAGFI